MTRDFLKELEIPQESVDKIMAEYGKSINSLKSDNEAKAQEVKKLNEQLAKYSDYEELSALKPKYEELQKKYTEDLSRVKLDNAITEKLYKSKAKNVDLLKKSIDLGKIQVDEKGVYNGIEEQINALKESDGYLFASEKEPTPSAANVGLGNDKNEPKLDPVSQAFYKRYPDLKK